MGGDQVVKQLGQLREKLVRERREAIAAHLEGRPGVFGNGEVEWLRLQTQIEALDRIASEEQAILQRSGHGRSG